MKKPILWIVFFAAIGVRILYAIAVPDVFVNTDTSGYYGLGLEIIRHPDLHTIITPFRTPLYPLVMNVIMYLSGFGGSVIGSAAFIRGIQYVAAVQMLVGAIAFTLLYKAVSPLMSRRLGYIIGVFLLCDVLVIGWERTMLTEGLAISVLIMITASFVHILYKPTRRNFVVFLIFCIFGFLLRPAFLGIPVVTLPIAAWYFRKRATVVFLVAVTLAAYFIVPFAYAKINEAAYGYFGIQYVGDIDVLGRILESRVPVVSAASVPYFYRTATEYESMGGNPHPFRFLEYYDPDIYAKPYRMSEIGTFNRLVLSHTIPQFVISGLQNIPEVLSEVCDFITVPRGRGPLSDAVWFLQQIYASIRYVTFVIPVVWVVYAVLFILKPTRWRAFVVVSGTIAFSQILMTALFVYKDVGAQYGRAISVVRPQMFLFLICSIADFLHTHQD